MFHLNVFFLRLLVSLALLFLLSEFFQIKDYSLLLLVLLDEGRPAEVVGVFENAVDDAALE